MDFLQITENFDAVRVVFQQRLFISRLEKAVLSTKQNISACT